MPVVLVAVLHADGGRLTVDVLPYHNLLHVTVSSQAPLGFENMQKRHKLGEEILDIRRSCL